MALGEALNLHVLVRLLLPGLREEPEAGVLLVVMGLRTLLNQKLEDKSRKRGFWPLNAGVLLAVVSMYMMTMAP